MRKAIQRTGAVMAITLATCFAVPHAVAEKGGLELSYYPSDENPGPPTYARIDSMIYGDGEWAALVFYRYPDCIPTEFNLLDQIDFPAAWDCDMAVEGTVLWQETGVGAPKIDITTGTGAVPVWFVPYDVFAAARADGVLKMEELLGLEGLMMGSADHFNQVIHPRSAGPGTGGHPVFKLIINARGQLEDGTPFQVHITRVEDDLRSVQIHFQ